MRNIVLLTLSAFAVWGQTERGNITGGVTDSTGAAVPGAVVTVTNIATNQVTAVTSTTAGDYNVPTCRRASTGSRSRRKASRKPCATGSC